MKKYNNQTVIFDHLNADKDNFIAVIGPCSVQSQSAAEAVAEELLAMQKRVSPKCLIVMRVYIDKPRSCIGWRGLLYSNPVEAVRTLISCSEMLPIAVEIVDPHLMEMMLSQHMRSISDVIALPTIGARTSESQLHRVAASGWKTAAGIKNPMDGDVDAFAAGCRSIYERWLAYDAERNCMDWTPGNDKVLGIWRGDRAINSMHIEPDLINVNKGLVRHGLEDMPVIVDLNHGNAAALKGKVHRSDMQQLVLDMVIGLRDSRGLKNIRGFMAEGHIREGRSDDPHQDEISITDYCNSLEQIEAMINDWK